MRGQALHLPDRQQQLELEKRKQGQALRLGNRLQATATSPQLRTMRDRDCNADTTPLCCRIATLDLQFGEWQRPGGMYTRVHRVRPASLHRGQPIVCRLPMTLSMAGRLGGWHRKLWGSLETRRSENKDRHCIGALLNLRVGGTGQGTDGIAASGRHGTRDRHCSAGGQSVRCSFSNFPAGVWCGVGWVAPKDGGARCDGGWHRAMAGRDAMAGGGQRG